MIIKCPKCQSTPSVADVNISLGSALCRKCDIGFSFKSSTFPEKPQYVPNDKDQRIIVRQERSGLVIEYSWRRWIEVIFLGFFTLFWNTILILVFLENKENFLKQVSNEPAMLIFLLHPIVGLFFLYLMAVKLFNKTRIIVTDLETRVTVGPLWWPGSKVVKSSDISQLYVERYVAYRQNHRPVFKFKLKFINQGEHQVLVQGLLSSNSARRIEEVLEERLGIQDQRVELEYVAPL